MFISPGDTYAPFKSFTVYPDKSAPPAATISVIFPSSTRIYFPLSTTISFLPFKILQLTKAYFIMFYIIVPAYIFVNYPCGHIQIKLMKEMNSPFVGFSYLPKFPP